MQMDAVLNLFSNCCLDQRKFRIKSRLAALPKNLHFQASY